MNNTTIFVSAGPEVPKNPFSKSTKFQKEKFISMKFFGKNS